MAQKIAEIICIKYSTICILYGRKRKARPYEFACDKVLKKRSCYVGLKDIIKPVLNVLFIELLK